ncbi:MAG: DUF1553 domain-containing protein [Pirellulaceae bacterium]
MLVVALLGPRAEAEETDAQRLAFFEKKIRPVLVEKCYACHSAEVKQPKGGLMVDSRDGLMRGGDSGPAVVPGQPAESLLIAAIQYDEFEMPPSGKLPEAVLADFRHWVEMGLPDPRREAKTDDGARPLSRPLWSTAPLRDVAPPDTPHSEWPRDPIDRFVLARLHQAGLQPAPDASRATLMRRLYFDLIGLPPTLDQQQAFLADKSPDAEARLVDRLLESPHFGERWGRHWLDVARFAESNGGDRNVIHPHAWRYRDYVVAAFNRDKPYDVFLREQIAGDLLPYQSSEQHDEQRIATGLLTLGPKLFMETDAERFRMDVVDEQIDVVSRGMLGLTVSCARCHDHKFDPIPTRDYYALAGVFRSSLLLYGAAAPAGNQYGHDRPLQPIGEDAEELEGPALAWQKAVADQTSVRNKARSDRYRVVRDRQAKQGKREMLAKGESPEEQLQDASLQELDAELARLEAEIAEWDEKIKQLDAELEKIQTNPPPFPDYCMAVRDDQQVDDSPLYVRGDVKRPDTKVPRGVLSAIPPRGEFAVPAGESGRRELAFWLTHPDNPLTPRVAVNRVWQHLLGEGLVRTVDNFGQMGEKPTHGELLDYLAREFQRDGWSVKRLIRRIVLSRTYQLSSRPLESAASADPDNRLLSRQNARPLEAEAIRDAVLAAVNRLDRSLLPESVVAPLTDREFNDRIKLTAEQKESRHRSVYLPVARFNLPELLETFDFPDPSLLTGRRHHRTLPAQQLFMLNNPWLIEQATHLATELQREDDDARRVDAAYRRILCREPTSDEREQALAFLASERDQSPDDQPPRAWIVFCQTLFASAEFRYLE